MHVPMLFDCLLFAMLGAGSRDHVTTPKMLLRRHGGPFQGLGHLPRGGGWTPSSLKFGILAQFGAQATTHVVGGAQPHVATKFGCCDTLPYIAVNGSKWFVRIMIGPFDRDLYVLLHINLWHKIALFDCKKNT
jgi:hypothetical protein